MAGTYVYVIGGDHGRQKIGVSDDPRRRISELQTGSPFPLRFAFVGQTDGFGYDIEGEVHYMLHQHRQSGEWFTVPPEVAIAAVMGAAYRMGHAIRPVDVDQIRGATFQIGVSKLAAWAQWSLCMMVYFAVLCIATNHDFITAIIAAWLLAVIMRILVQAFGQLRDAWMCFQDFMHPERRQT
jgi:hypothetical protein